MHAIEWRVDHHALLHRLLIVLFIRVTCPDQPDLLQGTLDFEQTVNAMQMGSWRLKGALKGCVWLMHVSASQS